jgi:hypothetical protein
MPEQQTNEHTNLESHQREFGERFASWWNRGAKKTMQGETKPVASETTRRDAA